MALQVYYTDISNTDETFRLLDEDFQATEESLMRLEAEIAKKSKQNESVLSLSESLAARTTLR